MKRNRHIIPLSHQHHDVLMAVLLLKKGLQKQRPINVLIDFIVDFQETCLKRHFLSEEMALSPFADRIVDLDKYLNRMLQEHRTLFELINQICTERKPELVLNWATLMEQHIRFEERVLFPFLETNLLEHDLECIGASLQLQRTDYCINYPIKFWE